jgi:Holliday junction resolvase-like predicted endonuclease
VPAEAVGPVKQARIRRLAARWLREHHERLSSPPTIIRFDVAAILGDRLEVLEAAF